MFISSFGALAALFIALLLILKKLPAPYALMVGALIGALLGGASLSQAITTMVDGAASMMSAILRILASGVLVGCLVQTGAARRIAQAIVQGLGQKRALAALILASLLICSIGVFIDITIITVAPIALAICQQSQTSKQAALLAMIGGAKAGNLISPNPNTLAVASSFGLELSQLILQNLIPALVAGLVTLLLAQSLNRKLEKANLPTEQVAQSESSTSQTDQLLEEAQTDQGPSLLAALLGPLTVVVLLALRPLVGFSIDPILALPLGGLVTLLACREGQQLISYCQFGLDQVKEVCLLLIGTGTVAGIISASQLQADLSQLLQFLQLPPFLLAPLSGLFMGAATASTTAGASIASQSFAPSLIAAQVPPLPAGGMLHAGATVLDSLPHGSFFHATAGSVHLNFRQRMALIRYEATIGASATLLAVLAYLITA
ncbi:MULTISPECIES: GntP family permease [Aerococcus]|uniref:GntP family permease n=1 Tax=Aerococcus sanguinicola TaxID=119206 RepID=A0A5N1GIN1_9LACT|nr:MULTISPECIES: SLC13 family permease [Aerococcus]KAA9300196.1 GntP family permease [Aerococcus sanguinicola]MDK6369540.1 SLC13 family permease [Aerococcus sp. UMB9870]MDK6680028.1 SLC13 family permease [Aerococcus sp. UMB8608]MDK6686091.1 SLC13 family permease [Aerococcus sp. UMB8623]MDK6939871.1 SLC13 family permease [Aerococcus sp. UMB8487]